MSSSAPPFFATEYEENAHHRAVSDARGQHYAAVYSIMRKNLETKMRILAHEQQVCETAFETGATLVAHDDDDDDDETPEANAARPLRERLAAGFAKCRRLHGLLLSNIGFPAELVYSADLGELDQDRRHAWLAARSASADEREQREKLESAESAFRAARVEIEALELRIDGAAVRKHRLRERSDDGDSSEARKQATEELETLVAQRFQRVNRMLADVTMVFVPSSAAAAKELR